MVLQGLYLKPWVRAGRVKRGGEDGCSLDSAEPRFKGVVEEMPGQRKLRKFKKQKETRCRCPGKPERDSMNGDSHIVKCYRPQRLF